MSKELESYIPKLIGGGRNGKEIQNAINLYNQIKKIPSCKLFGIKNRKGKVILLTKDEYIPKYIVTKKVKEVIELIEDEQFKVIMGDTTKCNKIKYILQELLERN